MLKYFFKNLSIINRFLVIFIVFYSGKEEKIV